MSSHSCPLKTLACYYIHCYHFYFQSWNHVIKISFHSLAINFLEMKYYCCFNFNFFCFLILIHFAVFVNMGQQFFILSNLRNYNTIIKNRFIQIKYTIIHYSLQFCAKIVLNDQFFNFNNLIHNLIFFHCIYKQINFVILL